MMYISRLYNEPTKQKNNAKAAFLAHNSILKESNVASLIF